MRVFPRGFLALCFLLSAAPAVADPPTAPTPPVLLRAPVRALVTQAGEAYLPGAAQMVAPAKASEVILHPQGRYALIIQNEAAPPPGAAIGKSMTGAAALLLYDARLNKAKTLWEWRADGAEHNFDAYWLPGSNCAIVLTYAIPLPPDNLPNQTFTSSLLFFNFEKSLNAHILLTLPEILNLYVSQTKPVYFLSNYISSPMTPETAGQVVNAGKQLRRGDARGVLGIPLTVSRSTLLLGWNANATTMNGYEYQYEPPATPDAKPKMVRHWFEWDGIAAAPTLLPARPAAAQMEKEPTPLVLPFAAQTITLAIPPRSKSEAGEAFHPLYLEAGDTGKDTPNHAVLLAPDADESFLLADKNAVLYTAGGALYAVPLVHLGPTAFADVQKAALRQAALSNAKQIGLGILGYIQDYDEKFPPEAGFKDLINPYIKNADLLNGFTYVYPGVNQAGIENVSTAVLGYVSTPDGRAVLYADGHVKWEGAN